MPGGKRLRMLHIVLLLGLIVPPQAVAQTSPQTRLDSPDNYPPALPRRIGPVPPPLAFSELARLSLPGPLRGSGVRLEDGRLVVAAGDGTAWITPGPQVRVELRSSRELPADGDAEGWVLSRSGRRRYRTLTEGWVLAQRRRARRWHRAWKLRVGGATMAPPLLDGSRLFFGSLDNRVYAVRSDNGHRLWATDVEDRVSYPLSLWRGRLPGEAGQAPPELKLILLIPDRGESLLALDPHDGGRVASLDFSEGQRRLVPPVWATRDGRILVAVQGYAESEAELRVLQLAPAQADPAETAEVPYNGPTARSDPAR